MKKISKAILMAALGLVCVPALKASSGYDLIAGFTTGSGFDDLVDLGPIIGYPGATPISFGETWDLTTDFPGINPANVSWGVIGDAIYSDGASTQTLWVTTPGNIPPSLNSDGSFGQADTAINSIEINAFGGGTTGYQSSQNQTITIDAGNQNSWNQQTISGSLGSQFVNAYGNPNVSGETSDTLWEVVEGGSPIALGDFSLSTATDGDTILTFSPVPEPGTWTLLSTFGLLALLWRYQVHRKRA